MDAKYIALAIPFFLVMIGIELAVSRARGQENYRLHDAITSLGCGVGQQILGVFFTVATVAGYAWVHARAGLLAIGPGSLVAWALLMLALDLCYYAVHRASHRVNFLWATHAVHHQSEDYNLATALRQSWFFSLVSWVFYLPLAVIGFPPEMFVAMLTINTLYQFWIHTRTVGRLGPLEWVLNTPSHHRVHHGIDPEYIDKNYAGMFIVWDRLFGTFRAEDREPVYGTVKPLRSFSSWWANLDDWVRIARMSRAARRRRDKVLAWIMPPEWRPEDLGGVVTIPEVDRAAYRKFDVTRPRSLDLYVVTGFVLTAFATAGYLWAAPALPRMELAAAGAVILATLLAWGGLIEGRRWAVPVELARLAAGVGVAAMLARGSEQLATIVTIAAGCALALGIWVVRAGRPPRGVAAAGAAGP